MRKIYNVQNYNHLFEEILKKYEEIAQCGKYIKLKYYDRDDQLVSIDCDEDLDEALK